ncbi:MAG: methyltransferase [Bacteroidales bacterium]|jgi:tRNA1Val (adenine37-N6)-methyltransferase|nr:methyltransferase [Bacteroidales bacterium]
MGKNDYFQFKHFLVTQNKAAMKVGTDGVLLGSWVNVQNEKKILDIGTGTGLIALMMAQRTSAQIIGIEIEKNAAEEALYNCTISDWKNRLSIQNISFQEFAEKSNEKFDLIISNPPFFINDQKSKQNNIAIAKHNDLLPLPDLISGSKKLISEEGKIAVILSVIATKKIIELINRAGLFVTRLTEVFPTPQKEANRCLIEFSKTKQVLQKNTLTILDKSGGDFSESYKELTKDFYLKF